MALLQHPVKRDKRIGIGLKRCDWEEKKLGKGLYIFRVDRGNQKLNILKTLNTKLVYRPKSYGTISP